MFDSRHRLSSSGASVSRMSQLQSRFTGGGGRGAQQESYIVSPYQNQLSSLAAAADAPNVAPGYATAVRPTTVVLPPPARPVEPTHFHWNTSSRRKRPQQPSDGTAASVYKPRLNCTVSCSCQSGNGSSAGVKGWPRVEQVGLTA